MTLMTIVKQAEKFTADNSPLILTAIGVAGTVTTAVLTGKASIKAHDLIRENEPQHGEQTGREKVLLTWKLFVPPITVGALTVTSIILANQIGTRRAAAMAAAYAVSEKAFSEYKDEVIKKLGETKERAIRDDLAQEQVNENPIGSRQVIITGGGNVLCYEPYTGRYFHSDMETLKKAQNDLNYKVLNHYYASLTDFYDLIGLDQTDISDEVGWNSDDLLDLVFSTVLADDGRPCLSMSYKVAPIRKYFRVQ